MPDLYTRPSIYLKSKSSNTSNKILNLGPLCPNLDFRHEILKYQCQIHIYRRRFG